MDLKERLERLHELDRRLVTLQDAIAVLGFDEETVMPQEASAERGEQLALLSGLRHEEATSGELRDLVASLEGEEGLDSVDCALVHHHKRFLETEGKLPRSFVEEEAAAIAASQSAWVRARSEDDYASYAPILERIVDLERRKAEYIRPGADPYDTLLDLYEEGMDEAKVASVFNPLEDDIHAIMDSLAEGSVEDSFLYHEYDRDRLHAFCLDVISRMGFDSHRGCVSISAHPFTSCLGRDDVRITTRYSDPSWFDSISTIVHECGHALYDMHATLNPATRGSSLGNGRSMSLHESQSRFWENMILRDRPFWMCMYADLQKALPFMEGVSLDHFLRAINQARPSAIRVNADELTYPLHIIMRFRLERDLIRGELSVRDLAEAWRAESLRTVRYRVENDSEGCLQDVHWPQGMFGYFPSYALGSIAAASFKKSLEEAVGGKDRLDEAIAFGDWKVVTDWQDRAIWHSGSIYGFDECVRRVTGRELDVAAYNEYLVDKFTRQRGGENPEG